MEQVFVFVKENLSGAERRKSAGSRERGAGKGAAALVPASAHSNPERDQRSDRTLSYFWLFRRYASLFYKNLLFPIE